MGDTSVMSARQSAELDHAFERNGYTAADVKVLSTGYILKSVLPIVRGGTPNVPPAVPTTPKQSRFGRVEMIHIINLDAEPFVPDGWSYNKKDQLPNRARGEFVWDTSKTRLHLSPNQQGGKVITGNDLKKELKLGKHSVLGANVLDYLLENPHLIPDSWKGKAVFFWGTVYRDSGGNLVVRYLYWNDGQWRSHGYCLAYVWHGSYPAAVRAN